MKPSDIRDAVRECLTECLSVDMPLSAMASYLSQLRTNDWPDQDIHRVELIIVKVLSRLVHWSEEMSEEVTMRSSRDQ